MKLIKEWFQRRFSDPQAVMLAIVLVLGFAVVLTTGKILAPVLAALVIAYILNNGVHLLERLHLPHLASVLIVFTVFMTGLILMLFSLLPELLRQSAQLFQLLPAMISKGQALIVELSERYPQAFAQAQVDDLVSGFRSELSGLGQEVLSLSWSSLIGGLTLGVYLVLVPMMVFFFLKDKAKIRDWAKGYLPHDSELVTQVWKEMDCQLGNYINGKFWEIIIVWFATYIGFAILGLQFGMLLAFLAGLSVVVPYVGFVAITLPITLVAYFQFGWTGDFAWVMGVYLIIQALDGNVLVPLLFSEVVNLHPVAIIVAVLFFGGLWGFWGVFFAIPLATLVKAVLNAWPDTPTPSSSA